MFSLDRNGSSRSVAELGQSLFSGAGDSCRSLMKTEN